MLYIHVPFCRHKCVYCDFMSGTNIALRHRYISHLRQEYAAVATTFTESSAFVHSNTLYFGGGTPSILTPDEISEIYCILGRPSIDEWTIECNPEDMTADWLSAIRVLGVTRLSVGVQSLDNNELQWMERRHTAAEAIAAIRLAQSLGFSNISADIIFGLPRQSLATLRASLAGLLSLNLQHISAYSLMFEQGSKITMKNVTPIDDDLAAEMYALICNDLAAAGYEHYEISNWAKPGFRSIHNSGYWRCEPYIGLGPAAHSFDGVATRRANVPNTLKWLQGVAPEVETLTLDERFNERVMLGLRTVEGINLASLGRDFPEEWINKIRVDLSPYGQYLRWTDDSVTLFPAGVYLSDMIMEAAMRV